MEHKGYRDSSTVLIKSFKENILHDTERNERAKEVLKIAKEIENMYIIKAVKVDSKTTKLVKIHKK